MTAHPNRSRAAKAARAYVAAMAGVERVRISDGEVHAYGTMPNTSQVGWYLAGSVDALAALAVPNSLVSVAQAAVALHVSERRVRALCAQGRIPGAQRIGSVWVLPKGIRVIPSACRPDLGR